MTPVVPRSLLLILVCLIAAGCAAPRPAPSGVGDFPRAVLSATPAVLLIEAHHAPRHAPSPEAQAHLLATLHNVTKKQAIEWSDEEDPELADPGHPWNLSRDLAPLAQALRKTADSEARVVLVVLYPGGKLDNADATGVSLSPGGPSVVFLDALRQNPSPGRVVPLPASAITRLERVTLLHEASHAIGLVNAGLPMQKPHEDAAHPLHSNDPKSVMYSQIDSTNALRDILLRDGSVPDTYDADDQADLAAGGRPLTKVLDG